MSEPTQQIRLIRHGETEWSASMWHTGRTGIGLTPTGERQANVLGGMSAERRFAVVRCSNTITRSQESIINQRGAK